MEERRGGEVGVATLWVVGWRSVGQAGGELQVRGPGRVGPVGAGLGSPALEQLHLLRQRTTQGWRKVVR